MKPAAETIAWAVGLAVFVYLLFHLIGRPLEQSQMSVVTAVCLIAVIAVRRIGGKVRQVREATKK